MDERDGGFPSLSDVRAEVAARQATKARLRDQAIGVLTSIMVSAAYDAHARAFAARALLESTR